MEETAENYAQPLRIGTVEVRNRLAMAPFGTYLCTDDCHVTDALCEHYRERAEAGNVGLIITEHCFVSPEGQAKPRQVSISRDADTSGLARIAQVCHTNGVKAFCQLSHAGGAARLSVSGLKPVAPSAIVSSQAYRAEEGDGAPRALSEEEIARIVEDFARAAQRAQEAGFDGVEIHAAHAYLLDEFYSPLLNKRTDTYGGNLENRIRIHREVIRAVRAATDDAFVVGMRLGGCDYEPGGATIEDAQKAAAILEAEGLDYLSVSGGWHAWRRPDHKEPGWFADQSRAVRETVSIPVMTAGGVQTLEDAEKLLASGVCDFVGIGRKIFTNPNWPND